jgi:hypothetical protein
MPADNIPFDLANRSLTGDEEGADGVAEISTISFSSDRIVNTLDSRVIGLGVASFDVPIVDAAVSVADSSPSRRWSTARLKLLRAVTSPTTPSLAATSANQRKEIAH